MEKLSAYIAKFLGLKVPEGYGEFMDIYGKKLASDPVNEKSWMGGLGAADFVVGTTLAFRSKVPAFGKDGLVIGYAGMKTIIVNKMYQEIDEYLVLDTADGSLLKIDSLGVAVKVAETFDDWITPELLRATLREKHASHLTVLVFDDLAKAEEARRKLLGLQWEGFVDLEDCVVVVKERDGKVRYQQQHNPARKGTVAVSITGLIVGSIFFSPLAGAAIGALIGMMSASLADIGIDEQFIKDFSRKFSPGSSALFTLVRKAESERVREAFSGFGGKVLVNSVSKEREAMLQKILDEAKEGAA